MGIKILDTSVSPGRAWRCRECDYTVDKWYTEFQPTCENCRVATYMHKLDVVYGCSVCEYLSREKWCVYCKTVSTMDELVEEDSLPRFECGECKMLLTQYYCNNCKSTALVWPLSEKRIVQDPGSLAEALTVTEDLKTWANSLNAYPHKGKHKVGFTTDSGDREKRQAAIDKGNQIVGPL